MRATTELWRGNRRRKDRRDGEVGKEDWMEEREDRTDVVLL